jgi:hypothetical protein
MPPPPQQRELRYNVTLVTDPRQAIQGMQQVGQSVDAVGQRAKAAQQEIQRAQAMGAAYGAGQVYGAADAKRDLKNADAIGKALGVGGGDTAGGGDKALAGGGVGVVGKLFAAAAALQTVGNLTDAIAKMGDSATGAREKVLGFASAVPVVGDAIASIMRNTFDLVERVRTDIKGGAGTYDKQRERIARLPFEAAENAANFGGFARLSDIDAADETAMEKARLGVFQARDLNALRFGDPNLTGSEKQFDAARRAAQSTVIGVRGQRDDIQAGINASAGQIGVQERRRDDAQYRSENDRINLLRVSDRVGGDPTREGELIKAKLEAEKSLAESRREQQRLEQLITRNKEQQLALTQAESQLRKANLGVAQAELQIVNQKIDKAKASASQFADMDPAKQQAVLRAVDRAKEMGYKELSPEQKALLRGTTATAEFANKLAEKAGGGPVLDEIFKGVGDQDQRTLKAERERLEGSIKLGVEIDATSLRNEVEKVLKSGIGQVLKDAVGEALRLTLNDIYIKEASQRVSKK